MCDYVPDTHALSWHLIDDPTLSRTAQGLLLEADRGVHGSVVPGIALVDLVYLIERGRRAPEPLEELLRRIESPIEHYRVAPLDQDTARALRLVPRPDVPDMPDRINVATALRLGLPLISRDRAIQQSAAVPIIW